MPGSLGRLFAPLSPGGSDIQRERLLRWLVVGCATVVLATLTYGALAGNPPADSGSPGESPARDESPLIRGLRNYPGVRVVPVTARDAAAVNAFLLTELYRQADGATPLLVERWWHNELTAEDRVFLQRGLELRATQLRQRLQLSEDEWKATPWGKALSRLHQGRAALGGTLLLAPVQPELLRAQLRGFSQRLRLHEAALDLLRGNPAGVDLYYLWKSGSLSDEQAALLRGVVSEDLHPLIRGPIPTRDEFLRKVALRASSPICLRGPRTPATAPVLANGCVPLDTHCIPELEAFAAEQVFLAAVCFAGDPGLVQRWWDNRLHSGDRAELEATVELQRSLAEAYFGVSPEEWATLPLGRALETLPRGRAAFPTAMVTQRMPGASGVSPAVYLVHWELRSNLHLAWERSPAGTPNYYRAWRARTLGEADCLRIAGLIPADELQTIQEALIAGRSDLERLIFEACGRDPREAVPLLAQYRWEHQQMLRDREPVVPGRPRRPLGLAWSQRWATVFARNQFRTRMGLKPLAFRAPRGPAPSTASPALGVLGGPRQLQPLLRGIAGEEKQS